MSEAVPTTESEQDDNKEKALSREDLDAFIQKRGTVTRAQLDLNMIVSGYETWAASLRKKYSLTDEDFAVDQSTGKIQQPAVPAVAASPEPTEPVNDG